MIDSTSGLRLGLAYAELLVKASITFTLTRSGRRFSQFVRAPLV
jgi:hypothetical protein